MYMLINFMYMLGEGFYDLKKSKLSFLVAHKQNESKIQGLSFRKS